MPTFPLPLTHLALARHQAQQIARILRENPDQHLVKPAPGTLPGDQRALRGIPVVGAKGVGGAITGSRPGDRITLR